MISCSLALIVNFPGQKPQNAIIRKAAPPAFFIVATILASGVFVGILGQGEPSMLTEMANVLLGLLPESLGKYLHIIMGILSAPLGLVFGNDAYLYGVLPLCIEVGENYGIAGEAMGLAMAIGKMWRSLYWRKFSPPCYWWLRRIPGFGTPRRRPAAWPRAARGLWCPMC